MGMKLEFREYIETRGPVSVSHPFSNLSTVKAQ